jgi:hypothetical protein
MTSDSSEGWNLPIPTPDMSFQRKLEPQHNASLFVNQKLSIPAKLEPPSINNLEKCFKVFSILMAILMGIFTDPNGVKCL